MKLKYYIRMMVFMAKTKRVFMKEKNKWFNFKINFLTLTLSAKQEHSDRAVKQKLLQPFLRIMRGQYGVRNYIWKAEVQSNGNIHFHILLDKFIHYDDVRRTWNVIQETLGYISRCSVHNPNSTDIHSVKGIHNIAEYIVKYLSKKEEAKRLIEGKIWDCNHELKMVRTSVEVCSQIDMEVRKLIEDGGTEFTGDHYSIIKGFKKESILQSRLFKTILTQGILNAYTPS